MNGVAPRLRAAEAARTLGIALPLSCGALLIGAAFAATAWKLSPVVMPGAVALALLAVVTSRRPEIGLAAAFPMVPLGNVALGGHSPWLLVGAWSVLLCAIRLARMATGAVERERTPRLTGFLIAILAVEVLTFALTSDPSVARKELRSLIIGLLLFFPIATEVRTMSQVRWVLGGAVAGAAFAGAIAVYQSHYGDPLAVGFITDSGELIGRVSAGFGQPNQLGGFLVILVPYALAMLLAFRRTRALSAIALGLAVFGIYASFSRGALIALLLIPFLFIPLRRALVLAPVLVGLMTLILPSVVQERFQTLSSSGSELGTRVDIWRAAASIWEGHPILGVGLGGFSNAYANVRVADKQFLPNTVFQPPPHAHNVFLQLLSEQGLLGLLAFLAVTVAAGRIAVTLRQHEERWLRLMGSAVLASLVAFCVHNVFDVTLLEGTGEYFWALLGIVSALAAIAARPGHEQPR